MAFDGHLKLGSLSGESAVKGFEGQIQISSLSFGVTNTGTTHQATGGGAGKSNVSDITFTHHVDSASPNLYLSCCNGAHFDKATFTLRKSGGDALVYLTVDLTDMIVSSVFYSGGAGEELITETVSVNFTSINLSYQAQDNKGAAKGGKIVAGWNAATNAKL